MHKTLPTNPSLPTYLVASSIWLTLQSTLLLLSPRLIVTFLAQDPRPPTTDLESYLCRALAFSLLTLAGFGVGSAIVLGRASEGDGDENAPPQTIGFLLPITVLYHLTATIQAYINYSSPSPNGNAAFLLNVVISAVLSGYGVWVGLFGSEVRVSSVDGRDKRVSGFLFGGGGAKDGKKQL